MFVNLQDKNKWFSKDYNTISHFFKLYSKTLAKYNIQPKDIYNINKKEAIIRVIGHQRCIVSKAIKRPKYTQDKNRE
jgi:hypothetical protein